ncbi:MAG: hypothetical protein L0Y80_09785, partial [Ignavibacteriae bacterium]|nr:hypothetical protein [Ignavibacteriota bacterium]
VIGDTRRSDITRRLTSNNYTLNFVSNFSGKDQQHPDTLKNLSLVGKTYGSGAIKVEPRALSNLPIPDYVLEEFSLTPPESTNLEPSFFDVSLQVAV